MIQRRWLPIVFAAWLFPIFAADPQAEALATINALAEALASDDSSSFLSRFDLSQVEQQSLRESILALIASAQVSSSVELVTAEGDADKQTLELDWLMNIHSRSDVGGSEARRQNVKIVLIRYKKHWRIHALEPADFFRPLSTSSAGASRNSSGS